MVRVLITNYDVEKSVRPIVVVKCISRHTLLTLDIRLISPSVQALYPLLSSSFSLFLTPSFDYIYVVPRVHSVIATESRTHHVLLSLFLLWLFLPSQPLSSRFLFPLSFFSFSFSIQFVLPFSFSSFSSLCCKVIYCCACRVEFCRY